MTTLIATANTFGMTGLANWFKKVQAKLAYRAKVKRTIKDLSRLSDYELNDIGLTRGDIYGVATGDSTLERVRRSAVDTNTNLKGWV